MQFMQCKPLEKYDISPFYKFILNILFVDNYPKTWINVDK